MKKFFSFVYCLCLVVSCFTPFASAIPPHDGEYFYLTSKSGIGLHANGSTVHKHYYGGPCWDWFTAKNGAMAVIPLFAVNIE